MRLTELQNLFYVWMSKFEKRSLENIKIHCDFLNESYKLNLSHPNWSIFWPLVFNGLIDHIGKGYYALTPPVIIDYGTHYVYINYKPDLVKLKQLAIGIYSSEELENPRGYSIIKTTPLSILKQFPTVRDVVDTFDESLRDVKDLKFYNTKTNRGVAELESEGLTRYFSIPEELYMRELPDRTINPEAFAISYCYSRAINKEVNGIYNEVNKTLILPKFACPYLLYRTLLLHSLEHRVMPEINENTYCFKDVPKAYAKQLNRIFSNSIIYE